MFDPVAMCSILNEERVEYVVLGGFAAVVHGSALMTQDVDLVPLRTAENLDRLGRALRRMNAMIRTADEAVPAPMDGAFLAASQSILNLTTDLGDIDLTFAPAGDLDGFDGWRRHALRVSIAPEVPVLIASLDDVIESKRAAGRVKDLRDLPYLESLRDQIGNRPATSD